MEDLKISEEYLEELIGYISRSLVGKIMKRFELGVEINSIKNNVKELVYEELRHFRDLLLAHNKGLEITQFSLNKRKTLPTSPVK